MVESGNLDKDLTDSERLKILDTQINLKIVKGYNLINKSGFTFIVAKKSKIGFWAWFLIGTALIFVPVIGPFLFGIWTVIKIINIVNRKEIRESFGIDKSGKLQRVTF